MSLWVPRTVSWRLTSAFANQPTSRSWSAAPRSMIACCGLPTRLSAARPRAELAGATRPIRRSQRCRDPGAPSRGCGAASTQPTPDADLARPRRAQRAEQAAPYPVAPAAARFTENPAALARPPRRPPLDLPPTTTRPPTHPTADPGPGDADGPREPHLGLPPHPGRARRTRPSGRRFHRMEDPQGRWHRSRSATIRADLTAVPGSAGPRDTRRRLRPRRHRLPTPPLHPRRDRARHPPGARRRDHRPSHRGLGDPASPQPPHGPQRARRPVPVLDPRPGQPVHRRLRRGVRQRRHPHHPHPGAGTASKRDRGTLHRHTATRMPRSTSDHRPAPPRGSAAGVPRALQHPPPSPITPPTPAGRPHSPALRRVFRSKPITGG